MHKGVQYIYFFIIVTSMMLTSCNSSKITSEIEILIRKEYPGDGAFFASSELELKPFMDLPEWDIPELMVIEEYDTFAERTTSDRIIKQAKSFNGTPYKFGGTTSKGMDCSGLIYTAFKSENIFLPRISSDMAREGKRIRLDNVQPGDLLFFKTNSRQNKINHVGLVVKVHNKEVFFIHSSTSKGVITSSINETYWQKAFTEARRIL